MIDDLTPQVSQETTEATTLRPVIEEAPKVPYIAPKQEEPYIDLFAPRTQEEEQSYSDLRGDPTPFDIDKFVQNMNATEPIDRHAYNHESFAKVLFKSMDPSAGMRYNTMAALQRGTANLFAKLDLITQYLEAKGFGRRSGFFMDLAKEAQQNSNYWRQRAEAVGIDYLEELVSDVIGEAVPGVTDFALSVGSLGSFPYMAGARGAEQRQPDIRKQKDPFATGMLEAAKTGILYGIFRMMDPLQLHLKAPAFGTVFGIQEMEGAPEGEGAKAFAKGATKGVMFSAASRGGRLGLNEIYQDAQPYLESVKNMAKYGPDLTGEAGGGFLFGKPKSLYEQYVDKMKAQGMEPTLTAKDFEQFGKPSTDLMQNIKSLQPPGQERALVPISELRDKLVGKAPLGKGVEHGKDIGGSIQGIRQKAAEIYKNEVYKSGGAGSGSWGTDWVAAFHYMGSNGQEQIAILKSSAKEGKQSLLKKIEERLLKIEKENGPQEWSKQPKSGLMTDAEFDKQLLQLAQEGKIALHEHDFPGSLTPEARSKLLAVEDKTAIGRAGGGEPGKTYYVGVVPKESWLKGEGGWFTLDVIPPRERRESLYQNLVNKFASIENLDARAKALGATILPGESPRMRSREYLGLSGKVQSVLRDSTYRINSLGQIEITGEGLKPILDTYDKISPEKNFDVKQQELNDYLIAVRTIEDLQRPPNAYTVDNIVTPAQVADAQNKLASLTAKYGNLDHFTAVADRFYSYSKRVLHSLVDSGVMSEAVYQDIIAKNPHYVPFNRILEDAETTAVGGPNVKKPFTEARSPVKGIKGSELEIEDVIGSYIKNTYRIMNVAERNTVARTVSNLMRLRDANGVNLLDIEKVNIPVRPIRVSPEEIDTITNTFRSQAREIVNQAQTSTTVEGGPVGQAAAPATAPMTALQKIVKDALQSRGFTAGEADAALNRILASAATRPAPEGAAAPTAGTSTTTTITNTLESIIRETEKVIETPIESTIWRPSPYTPKGNIIEYYVDGKKQYMKVPDNLYDAMTGMNEVSADFLVKIMSAPASLLRTGVTITPEFMLRNFIRDQWDAFIQNKVGFRPVWDTTAALADVIGKTDVYYDWLRSGGAHSTFVDLSRDNLKHMTNELQKDPSAFRHLNIITTAQQISQAIEQATRLGIYKAGIRRGVSDVEAGFAAREGTVDFGVKGQNQTLRNFSSMTAFFNPAIQGTDRFMRAHKEDPVGVMAKATASVTIPSLVLWYMNKDDPDYKEIPTWQKNLFWLIRVKDGPDGFVRIPKPFLWGQVYGSAPERFAEYLETQDPKALKGFMKSLLDAATPVQGDPNGILLPTFAKPLIENATDWQFFRERPVVPVSRKNLLPEFQYGKYTGETAKQIGKALGWSPAKIENFVTGVSGGLGAHALKAADMALEALQGKEKGKRPTETADIPIVKAFAVRSVISDPQSLRDFYENAKQVEAEYASFRDSAKNLRDEDLKELVKTHPKLMLAPSIEGVKNVIATIDRAILLTSDSTKISDDKKREKIKQLEIIRQKIAVASNKIMEGKVKPGETADLTKSVEEAKGVKP